MVATWLFFVSHRMQRKDDDAGTTAYYCKQRQCQHARSQLQKQTLFEEERRPDEVIAEPLPQLQCIGASLLRSSHAGEEERAGLLHKVELLLWTRHGGTFHCSTLLATTLPKTRSSTAGCSEVWACNRSWQREEGIASERNCVCAAHPSQDQDMTQVKIYQTHWLVEDLTYLLEGLLNQSICFPN